MRKVRNSLGLEEALREQIFGEGFQSRFDEEETDYRDVLYSFNIIKTCLCNNTVVVKKFGKIVGKSKAGL